MGCEINNRMDIESIVSRDDTRMRAVVCDVCAVAMANDAQLVNVAEAANLTDELGRSRLKRCVPDTTTPAYGNEFRVRKDIRQKVFVEFSAWAIPRCQLIRRAVDER